jgi:hypothetical protein
MLLRSIAKLIPDLNLSVFLENPVKVGNFYRAAGPPALLSDYDSVGQ